MKIAHAWTRYLFLNGVWHPVMKAQTSTIWSITAWAKRSLRAKWVRMTYGPPTQEMSDYSQETTNVKTMKLLKSHTIFYVADVKWILSWVSKGSVRKLYNFIFLIGMQITIPRILQFDASSICKENTQHQSTECNKRKSCHCNWTMGPDSLDYLQNVCS